jgi:hypothetical protein
MYERHRALFDRYEMKNLFLSRGYLHSAKAHWRRSEPLGAVKLAMTSFRLAPADFITSIDEQTNRWVQRRWTGVQPTGEVA